MSTSGGDHAGPLGVRPQGTVVVHAGGQRLRVVLEGGGDVLVALHKRLVFAQLPRRQERKRVVGEHTDQQRRDDPAGGKHLPPPRLGRLIVGAHAGSV